MKNVKPLAGFRDLDQASFAARTWLIEKATEVYRQYGYWQIETPTIEREEILQGQYGDEGDKLRYRFTDEGGRAVGLRYDLTVPFARFVARFLPSGQIRLPYRRSQVAQVFRAESPQAGRFREFYQADFDIAGSDQPPADAEIIKVAYRLLEALGVDFIVQINHRGVMNKLFSTYGLVEEQIMPAMGEIDKLARLGSEEVRRRLVNFLEIDEGTAELLMTDLGSEQPWGLLERRIGQSQEFNQLTRIFELATNGLASGRVKLDLSIVRGLAYYTGMVLETKVKGAERFGSILSGGRFDETIGIFLGRQVPAVGASLGVDRALEVLGHLQLLPAERAKVDFAVICLPDQLAHSMQTAERLRDHKLTVTLVIEPSLSRAFGVASNSAKQAIIIGETEFAQGRVIVKDLTTREQRSISLEELFGELVP